MLLKTYQVQGSPVNISARNTLAKCTTAAPTACLDVSNALGETEIQYTNDQVHTSAIKSSVMDTLNVLSYFCELTKYKILH